MLHPKRMSQRAVLSRKLIQTASLGTSLELRQVAND
jgi:hypothetical protein